MKTLFILLISSLVARSEILRLSAVAEKEAPGVTRMELGQGDNKQILFVQDKAIITEADVSFAVPSPSREDSVDVTLSNAGGEKMSEATKVMRPGIDRIAIIVNGKISSAPVVQSVPLGKNFQISGLGGKVEARTFADRLMGKVKG